MVMVQSPTASSRTKRNRVALLALTRRNDEGEPLLPVGVIAVIVQRHQSGVVDPMALELCATLADSITQNLHGKWAATRLPSEARTCDRKDRGHRQFNAFITAAASYKPAGRLWYCLRLHARRANAWDRHDTYISLSSPSQLRLDLNPKTHTLLGRSYPTSSTHSSSIRNTCS